LRLARERDELVATVAVTNLAGHKLPSGVGFRRAFLAVEARDAGGRVLWSSGRTDALGLIVDGEGHPLPTELSRTRWQPHWAVVRSEGEAQVYESRHLDSRGELTTSFLALAREVKDNRLLPRGWRGDGPHADVTGPVAIDGDPRYGDGSGSDVVVYRMPLARVRGAATVRAAFVYQSIPPYYLAERFRTAPGGPETGRLYALASRLAVDGTPIEDWKLELASAERPVAPER